MHIQCYDREILEKRSTSMEGEATVSKNFIEQEIDKDLAEGRLKG